MTLYGMPPDDPSSLIPENTINADARGAFEQHADGQHDERLVPEEDDTDQPED